MNIFSKKILVILVIIILGSFTISFYQYQSGKEKQESNNSIPGENFQQSKQVIKNNNSSLKTYRNEEWGLEFQYPQNLILKENTFKNYYSKFNLELFTPIGEKRDSTFLVNIVLPEFAERSFSDLKEKSSEIIIDGIQGIKYQYDFERSPHIAIILPFRDLRIILATGDGSKQYLDEFNQILATFKFLK